MDSTAQNLPGSFATPNEAMDTTVAHSHGTVRARSRTPEAVMREGFRDESGVVKKVQVVERDALETQSRIRRRDKMITNLSAMVKKQTEQLKEQTEQLKEQALQVQQLLQISQSARETDAAAKATIERLSQQVDQFKEDAEKSNEALRQARKEALEAKQLTTAASQSSASELPSRSILRNSPAIAMGTPTKASVRFSQARTPPDPMSDSDEEMSVVSQELVPMDNGKGKMVDQGHKEIPRTPAPNPSASSSKGRYMEVSSDSSDSDSDMQAPYQSVPPPPAHIPRPRGGAGPPLTPRKQGAPSREVGRASFDSPSQEDSFALMFKGINTLGDQVGKLCELVSNGRMSNRTGHSPRSSPAISRVFKVPVDRSREEGRTEALKFCRAHVRTFFKVVHDKDFLKLRPASDDDIIKFEMDWSGPGPTPPYVPNWDKTTLRGEWNTRLFELLMEQIREGEVEYDDADIKAMRELFFEKLERVRRLIKEAQPKNGESPTNAQQRSHANHLRKLEGQKLHTRRQTTYEERIGICIDNMKKLTGEARKVWRNLHDMLEAMGPDGVSSDEEVVVNNRREYHVKILPHRSTRVLSRIQYIDKHANHTNGYGNSAPGTPPRIRIRPDKPEESRRKAPTGWPQNLYKSQWIEGLSDIHYEYLGAKTDFDLMVFELAQRFAGVSNFSQ